MPRPDGPPIELAPWVKPARLAVFPAVALPGAVADIGGAALAASAALACLGGAIEAVTFRVGYQTPVNAGAVSPRFINISFWDRLAVFSRDGASLTVALVLVVAAVLLTFSAGAASARWQKATSIGAATLAAVIVAVDAVMCVKALTNSLSLYSGVSQTNKFAALLDFMAPAALGAGAIYCLWLRATVRTDGPDAVETPPAPS